VSSIYVIGPEGSGTTILWECIAAHPELAHMKAITAPTGRWPVASENVVMHLSLPTLRPMQWFGPEALPAGSRVVAIARSPVRTVYSAWRRMYGGDPGAAWRSYFRAVDLAARHLAAHTAMAVAYEDLVSNPRRVLGSIYTFLGVDGGFVPSIELRDRSDERWRADAEFAGFLRHAFGALDAEDARVSAGPGGAGAELTLDCGGTRFGIVDATGGEVVAQLVPELPAEVGVGAGGAPDVRYLVEPRQGGPGASAKGYQVRKEGRVAYHGQSAERVVSWLRREIDEAQSLRLRDGLVLRGASVVHRGRAILVTGPRGAGTTTLVTELARRGALAYADGLAELDAGGCVRPVAAEQVMRAAGGPPPPELSLLVSTVYQREASWQPRELRGARAVLPIVDAALPERSDARRTLLLSGRLAARLVTLEGPRPDASLVAPRILEALDQLLDDRRGAAR
jgi:hypothetical protein